MSSCVSFDKYYDAMKTSTIQESKISTDYDMLMRNMLCKKCGAYALENCGESVSCNECGIVYEQDVIDEGNECRYYHHDDNRGSDPSRCGMPVNELMPVTNLCTSMDYSSNYVHKLHSHLSYSHKERDRIKVFSEIDNICARLKINSCIATKAKYNYNMIKDFMEEENDIKRKKNRKGIIGTCVYNACDLHRCPIREGDIARELGLDTNYISRGIKIFGDICNKKNIIVKRKVSCGNDAMYYLEKFCSILQFSETITNLVRKIVEKSMKFRIATDDHTPEAQTAGCVWFVIKKCNFDKSRPKSFIHYKIDVSEVTIARAYDKVKAFDDGKCPHRDDRDVMTCKFCHKFRPVKGCFTKYIDEYLKTYEDQNKLNYLINGAEMAKEKVKKKRGRKPKNKLLND